METQCNEGLFVFQAQNRRDVVATFDGGTVSTDGGALLLREAERWWSTLQRATTMTCQLSGKIHSLNISALLLLSVFVLLLNTSARMSRFYLRTCILKS